jgi:hypothetical protein
MVQDLFEKRTGVRTGISLLRHAYISNAFKNPKFSLKERTLLARKMFHSVDTQEKYRVMDEENEYKSDTE